MRLTSITVEESRGFPGQQLDGLSPGLNVVFGPNGSGKTTLARLTRDLLKHAEQDRSAGGVTAGSVEVEFSGGGRRIVRCVRPGHPDTVAVVTVVTNGSGDDGGPKPTPPEPVDDLVHFANADNLHRVDELGAIARRIPVRSGSGNVDREGDAMRLIAGRNWETVIGALRRQIEAHRLGCEVLLRRQVRRQRSIQTRLRWLDGQIDRQQDATCRLDAEWQAAASDLQETAGSAAGATDRPVQCASTEADGTDLRELDRRAAALQEVLEGLAGQRLRHTLRLAVQGHAWWCGVHEERDRLDRCEIEVLHQLREVQQRREGLQTGQVPECPGCGSRRAVIADLNTVAVSPAAGRRASALGRRGGELQEQLMAAREHMNGLLRRRTRLETIQRSALWDRSLEVSRYAFGEVEQVLVEVTARSQSGSAGRAGRAAEERGDAEAILARASESFRRLTQGRFSGLRLDAASGAVLTVDAAGRTGRVTGQSRGTSEQAALALRLAILRQGSGGETWPALWDDGLCDTDDVRLQAAAAELADAARDGQQLILFTCRERVVEALRARGASVYRLDEAGRVETRFVQAADIHSVALEMRQVDADAVTFDVMDSMETGSSGVNDAVDVPNGVAATDLAQGANEIETVTVPSSVAPPLVRVHPAEPHWLRGDSPLTQVPSLGFQFARRLRALHVNNVQDLIDLDPVRKAGLLHELQITVGQIQIWQAEARLLVRVPDLTARDAQLLASCGVSDAAELAQCNIDELSRRLDRLGGGRDGWHPGMAGSPRREAITRWIGAARGVLADAIARQVRTPGASGEHMYESDNEGVESALPLLPVEEPVVAASRFRLHPESPILDAPSIGLKTARLLRRAGINTVADLLECDAIRTAARLRHRRLTAEVIQTWQRQSGLMCTVPNLRCADAVVLVACGIANPLDLRRISPSALGSMLLPLLASAEGQRLLRGALPPTMEDIARWTETVEETRVRRAA